MRKLTALLLLLSLLLAGCSVEYVPPTAPVPEEDGLFVHFIDVGQADCALIEYGDFHMLIDGGNREDGRMVVSYLLEQGIETLEQAAAYIRSRNLRNSRMEKLKQQLQIRGRNLTAGEEKYAQSWLDMGFADEVIGMAYERTCLNTGGLSWAYMNKILQRWHEAGLHTAEEISRGDKKPTVPKGASGQLGQAELEAIERLMREDI